MFQKLKIKLILTNMILSSIILLSVFIGLFLMMRNGSIQQSVSLMTSVASEEQIIPSSYASEGKRILSECFYIKASPAGNIWDISPNLIISSADAAEIVKKALDSSIKTSTINYNGIELRFLSMPKYYGYILVFLDKSRENETLNRLVLTSAIIGCISLLLVFAVSFYLANKALIPVKNAWGKQKTFIADASHELRTPLSVINTNLEVVMSNMDETVESQVKWLGYMQSEIKRMSRLVEDLLYLARNDSDEEKLNITLFNMSTTLKQAVQSFIPTAVAGCVKLNENIQDEIFIQGDEDRIKQLAAILIDNALKHTPEGGKVTLTAEINASFIEISVSDTGEGIPSEDLSKIFERFYRADKSRSRKQGGSGLGLAIAQSIAERHGGTIGVDSILGEGTTFKVQLPVCKKKKGQI